MECIGSMDAKENTTVFLGVLEIKVFWDGGWCFFLAKNKIGLFTRLPQMDVRTSNGYGRKTHLKLHQIYSGAETTLEEQVNLQFQQRCGAPQTA